MEVNDFADKVLLALFGRIWNFGDPTFIEHDLYYGNQTKMLFILSDHRKHAIYLLDIESHNLDFITYLHDIQTIQTCGSS